MVQMGLDTRQRQRAIDLFKRGSAPDFALEPVISAFLEHCGNFANLKQTVLVYLISLALADGAVHTRERELLQTIASHLGGSPSTTASSRAAIDRHSAHSELS